MTLCDLQSPLRSNFCDLFLTLVYLHIRIFSIDINFHLWFINECDRKNFKLKLNSRNFRETQRRSFFVRCRTLDNKLLNETFYPNGQYNL